MDVISDGHACHGRY